MIFDQNLLFKETAFPLKIYISDHPSLFLFIPFILVTQIHGSVVIERRQFPFLLTNSLMSVIVGV